MAERRGFAPGAALQDWLQAERELDALLASGGPATLAGGRPGKAAASGAAVERRQSRRAPIHLPVQLNTHDGRVYHGVGSDLGRDGMFVRTPAKLTCGSVLDVRVEAPDVRTVLPVLVVHQANGGLGLRFRGLDAAVTAPLRRLADSGGG